MRSARHIECSDCVRPREGRRQENERHQPRQRRSAEKRAHVILHVFLRLRISRWGAYHKLAAVSNWVTAMSVNIDQAAPKSQPTYIPGIGTASSTSISACGK